MMRRVGTIILAWAATFLFPFAVAPAAPATTGPSADPPAARVVASAIAPLPDQRIALLLCGTGNETHLLISRDAHPVSLEDFAEPIVLLGPGGALAKENPSGGVAIAAAGDELHVVCGSGRQLVWYRTSLPVRADSKWQTATTDAGGDVMVEQLVTGGKTDIAALYGATAAGIGAATLRDGKLVTYKVAQSEKPTEAAPRGAFGADDHLLRIVWVDSTTWTSAQLNLGNGTVSPPRHWGEGRRPSLLCVGGRAFVATEQADGSILAQWTDAGDTAGARQVQKQQLKGFASLGPLLIADEYGVAWLLAVRSDRRAVTYRRFMGDGFGPEAECNPTPGAWKLSGSFAAHARSGPSGAGVSILEAKFDEKSNEVRPVFVDLTVPRYAVTDPRHVLFLDMLEVASIQNLQQKVATAVRAEANPLNLNGPPGSFDCAYAGYANVIVEGGKFRMWYNGRSDQITPDRKFVSCYAESADGISWTKPKLGLYEYDGSKQNNLIFPYETGACEPIVFRDDQEPDTSRRYKMVLESTYEGSTGVYLSWSADGIHWLWPPHRLWAKSPGKNQAGKGFNPWEEPLLSFFRDSLVRNENYRWKIYGQNNQAGFPHGDPNQPRNLSLVHGATPYDVVGYVENPVLDPRTGWQEDQIHGGLVQPYEGMYVSLYQHWFGPDWKVDLRLAASRDGVHFVRVQPQTAVLPLGADGAWDSGMLCTPNFMFARDGKLWLYYRGSVGTLATGRAIPKVKELAKTETNDSWRMMTGLAKLRADGFAFLTLAPMRYAADQPPRFTEVPDYAVNTLGTVTTIPIDAAGIGRRSLHVNIDNLAPGFAWLRAQLRDADTDRIIDGFSFDDCDRVNEGALDRQLSWHGSPSLAGVKAKRVRVEFQLHGALDAPQLYSFWFAGAAEGQGT